MAKMVYTERLSTGDQIDAEEMIASLLFDGGYDISEEGATDASKVILLQVLSRFRADLVTRE